MYWKKTWYFIEIDIIKTFHNFKNYKGRCTSCPTPPDPPPQMFRGSYATPCFLFIASFNLSLRLSVRVGYSNERHEVLRMFLLLSTFQYHITILEDRTMLFAFRHFAIVRLLQTNYYSAVNRHHVVRDCVPLKQSIERFERF